MASSLDEQRAVHGRLDRSGRLIAADPELETLQREAGSDLGQLLALPQVAAIAQLARNLGTPVRRQAVAASPEHDIDLWVSARPEGEEIALSLEDWTFRPAAAPRLASILGGGSDSATGAAHNEWATDEELRIVSLSSELARILGVDSAEATRAPLTRILRLEEDESGAMPLIHALAVRRDFTGQRARSRSDEKCIVVLAGEVVSGPDGNFAGFRGTAEPERPQPSTRPARLPTFDQKLDELLRSPLDRIIESAERIVANADGPLASDYSSYGTDIATAARHLLSVLEAMSEGDAPRDSAKDVVDLAALAAEAVIMLQSSAEDRDVRIELDRPEVLRAQAEERAVIQILVNLIVNAIRHSPRSGVVRLGFKRRGQTVAVTVADEGPGIAAGDEERIFERFERAHEKEGGTGLGLAISRRLARAMAGDVTLDSAPGEGARFTLSLPAV